MSYFIFFWHFSPERMAPKFRLISRAISSQIFRGLCFPIAHVNQPKGLSVLFVFLIRPFVVLFFICQSCIFSRRFHIQRIADAFDVRTTRAIGAIAGS